MCMKKDRETEIGHIGLIPERRKRQINDLGYIFKKYCRPMI